MSNSKQPVVSALLPVYTGEEFINESICSILAQTFTDWELLIIGEPDGSTLIRSTAMYYAEQDSRIRYIENEQRLGLSASLNKGIALARGKYIARVDVDDPSYPARFEKQVAYLNAHPEVDILSAQQQNVHPDRKIKLHMPTKDADIKAAMLFSCQICHSVVMFRRNSFINNSWRYPTDYPAEDYALWLRIMDKAVFAALDDYLIDRRWGIGENISISNEKWLSTSNLRLRDEAFQRLLGLAASDMDMYLSWGETAIGMMDAERIPDWIRRCADFLLQMAEANRQTAAFDGVSLDRCLRRRWNWMLEGTMLLPPELFLPEIGNLDSDFETAVSLMLGTEKANVGRVLEQRAKECLTAAQALLLSRPRAVVFGLGYVSKSFFGLFQDHMSTDYAFTLSAFCDNDRNKGPAFMGTPVVTADLLGTIDYDVIIITPHSYYYEIYEQLVEQCGIPPSKILPLALVEPSSKEKLYQALLGSSADEPSFVLMNTPGHGNLGDHAIALAEHSFLIKRLGCNAVELTHNELKKNMHFIAPHISKAVRILITGGGHLGSTWFDEEKAVRAIIEGFPENPILIFPQTIFYSSDPWWQKELEKAKKLYNAHPNLTLCARDERSFDLMSTYFPSCKVILMPDMVLSLENVAIDSLDRHGALLCLKNDKESQLLSAEKGQIDEMCCAVFNRAEQIDTDLNAQVPVQMRAIELNKLLTRFAEAEIVITDRLHGFIFCAITATPCVIVGADNAYHKLRETYKWLSSLPYIAYISQMSELDDAIRRVTTAERSQRVEDLPCHDSFYFLEQTIRAL